MEKEGAKRRRREAGVLLFEEREGWGGGGNGLGEGTSMHGRAPLLPCERRGYCPGNLSESFPEVPCTRPPISLYPPPPHSLLLNRFSTCSGFPTETVHFLVYLTNCFSLRLTFPSLVCSVVLAPLPARVLIQCTV